MHEPDYGRIAELLADRGRVRDGDAVLLFAHDEAMPMAEELTYACYRRGALPMIITQWEDIGTRALRETDAATLSKPPLHLQALIGATDVVFYLTSQYKNPALQATIPAPQLAAVMKGRFPVSETLYDGNRRVIITDFPTRAQAAFYGVDFVEYHDAFWRSLDIDYAALGQNIADVTAFLKGKEYVHITTAKGTDVRLRIGGREIDADDGVVGMPGEPDKSPLLNLPTGEVCLAPWEDGADGRVVFDFAFIGGSPVRGLEIFFRSGQASLVGARAGFDRARDYFAAGTGNPYGIGELGIGMNPAIIKPTGSILMDEKIIGTIHLALGDNRTMGGTNQSSIHQDMIVLDPRVTCDSAVLLAEGRFWL